MIGSENKCKKIIFVGKMVALLLEPIKIFHGKKYFQHFQFCYDISESLCQSIMR